jgi:hypothetical protein
MKPLMQRVVATSYVNLRRLLAVYLMLALLGCRADESSVKSDELIGNQIIAALEKYKEQRGSYPDVLSELEPSYIPKITPPRYGEKRWNYTHYCKNDSFGLAMFGRRLTDDDYVYSSDRKKWEVAENSF